MTIDQFIEMVKKSPQQTCFFHFTDKSNEGSIRKYGLLSNKELARLKINANFGGNQWSLDRDKACGMDAYVHLGFKKGLPMEHGALKEGTIKELVHIKVKPEVLKLPGVLITPDVANQVGVQGAPVLEMLGRLDIEVLYSRTDWKNAEVHARLKAAERCEVIVPTKIPLEFLE